MSCACGSKCCIHNLYTIDNARSLCKYTVCIYKSHQQIYTQLEAIPKLIQMANSRFKQNKLEIFVQFISNIQLARNITHTPHVDSMAIVWIVFFFVIQDVRALAFALFPTNICLRCCCSTIRPHKRPHTINKACSEHSSN